MTGQELLLFVRDAKPFKLDRKFEFTIRITGQKTVSGPTNDIELIGFRRR